MPLRDESFMLSMRLEGLGKTLTAAFMAHADETKALASEAIEAAIKKTDIRKVFLETAERELGPAIKEAMIEAIQNWFTYGGGREMTKEVVGVALERWKESRR